MDYPNSGGIVQRIAETPARCRQTPRRHAVPWRCPWQGSAANPDAKASAQCPKFCKIPVLSATYPACFRSRNCTRRPAAASPPAGSAQHRAPTLYRGSHSQKIPASPLFARHAAGSAASFPAAAVRLPQNRTSRLPAAARRRGLHPAHAAPSPAYAARTHWSAAGARPRQTVCSHPAPCTPDLS